MMASFGRLSSKQIIGENQSKCKNDLGIHIKLDRNTGHVFYVLNRLLIEGTRQGLSWHIIEGGNIITGSLRSG